MNWKKMGCWAALVAVAVLLAGPAVAVPGLTNHQSDFEEANSVSPKTAIARCPPTKQVIGGGALINELVAAGVERQVVLTTLVPVDGVPHDAYVVRAEEPAAGVSHDWQLFAAALCADPLAGHQIVHRISDLELPTFVTTAAVCPIGKRVIGTGSEIINSGNSVGLQLSRASGSLDISRSTARERAGGYSNSWWLRSYAICVNPVNVQVRAKLESSKFGSVCCQDNCALSNNRVHSAGGGGSLVDTGASFLTALFPNPDLLTVGVRMTRPLPDGIVVQAICGF